MEMTKDQLADLSLGITHALFHSKKLLHQPPTKKQLKRKDYPEDATKVWLVETAKLVWCVLEDLLADTPEVQDDEPRIIV